MHKTSFAHTLTANTALPWPSLAVSGDAFCYSGHVHELYRRQRSYIKTERLQEIFSQSYKVQITPLS